jgi:hypothetical protein
MLLAPVRAATAGYLTAKAGWSLANDAAVLWDDRRPVPRFNSPEEIDAYAYERSTYRLDPLWGLGDFYTSPYRAQADMERGIKGRLYFDCDDLAGWAYKALIQLPGCTAKVITLADAKVSGSHVIAVYSLGGVVGAIDTNRHRRLSPLHGTDPFANWERLEKVLTSEWSAIYEPLGYRYVFAADSPYPF